ncbi:hypothetical protein B0H13DRAFT_469468 [Mycena leptocephala]|nr:hypothetical protein B0H13DRAFT_469468 [Mycena leptocephala]
MELQFVDVGTLDLAALTHLGGLRTLGFLTTKLPVSISFPSASNGTLFPQLHTAKLRIERGNILGMTELVRTWNCPLLQSLEILFTESYTSFTSSIGPQSFQEFYDVLTTHCAPASFQMFDLDATDNYDSASEFVYPGHLLRSLNCFGNLTSVCIRVLRGYELDDEVVSDLAHAWPHLKELRLGTRVYDHHPRTTLLSLQTLAQHCPNLNTLEMTFDATTVPPARTSQARIIQHNLVGLD